MDPDLDPIFRGMDPQIRIRTKMSRIPNTGYNLYLGARLLGVLNGGPVVDVDILVHGHQHLLQLYIQVSPFGLGVGWLQNY